MDERGPAVDAATIDELERSVGDDRAFLRELVETYLDDAPAQVAAMRAGLLSTDWAQVHRAAHTLKSNSASVGAMTLAELCRQLEALTAPGRADDLDPESASLRERLAAIDAELERVAVDLDALVPAAAA
jgi:HPt (histidine-containing phosphotransfer) domain-containing protein